MARRDRFVYSPATGLGAALSADRQGGERSQVRSRLIDGEALA
jgi:hypothetical protein